VHVPKNTYASCLSRVGMYGRKKGGNNDLSEKYGDWVAYSCPLLLLQSRNDLRNESNSTSDGGLSLAEGGDSLANVMFDAFERAAGGGNRDRTSLGSK
jgi:hypothetical protein